MPSRVQPRKVLESDRKSTLSRSGKTRADQQLRADRVRHPQRAGV